MRKKLFIGLCFTLFIFLFVISGFSQVPSRGASDNLNHKFKSLIIVDTFSALKSILLNNGAMFYGHNSSGLARSDFQAEFTNYNSTGHAGISIYNWVGAGEESAINFSARRSDGSIYQQSAIFQRYLGDTANVNNYQSVFGVHVVGTSNDNTPLLLYSNNSVSLNNGPTVDTPYNKNYPPPNTTQILGKLYVKDSSNSSVSHSIANLDTTNTNSRTYFNVSSGSTSLQLITISKDQSYLHSSGILNIQVGSNVNMFSFDNILNKIKSYAVDDYQGNFHANFSAYTKIDKSYFDSLSSTGVYYPVLTNFANVSSSSLIDSIHYTIQGREVTVSFMANVTPTANATLTTLEFPLPVHTTILSHLYNGSATMWSGAASGVGVFNCTGNTGSVSFYSTGTTACEITGFFRYHLY